MAVVTVTEGDYPQHYGFESSFTYYWDVGTLAWVKGTQSFIGPVTIAVGGIADGADVAEGATTDAAVTSDTTGTVSGKLRGLVKWAYERMPASLGQKTMAASFPVTIASDQSNVPMNLGDSASVDAFGRLRVSNPDTVFDAGFQYDLQPLIFQTSVANSGTVSHLPNEATASLATAAVASSSAILQSKAYPREMWT